MEDEVRERRRRRDSDSIFSLAKTNVSSQHLFLHLQTLHLLQVLFERRGSVGIATLNRPHALNALTETMVRESLTRKSKREKLLFDSNKSRKKTQPHSTSTPHSLLQVVLLFRQYSQWDADPSISCILLRGSGVKAFCAGGDVKAAALAVADGKPQIAFAFFKSEYRLNFLISRLTKPHIALIDGIVMGGGAGLSVHGRFRVATEMTIFAMPECAIGLFPDVGTTFFLPRACGTAVARWIALTGARLQGREVVESGVGTHFVRRGRLPELVEALSRLSSAASPSSSSSSLCASSSWMPSWLMPLFTRKRRCPVAAVLSEFEEKASPSSSSSFAALSKDVARLFGESCSSLEQLRGAVSREASLITGAPGWLRRAATALEAECPQSQALSWALLEASTTTDPAKGAASFSLADTLKLEWRILSRVSLSSPDSDFVEGVEARLLSKPARAARWRGDGGEMAAREAVARPLPSPREELELEVEGGGKGGATAAVQSRL